MKVSRPASRAFTLIELLVVIAIIGILASLVVPLVQSSRKKALMASGLSSLRQVNSAALSLAGENGGKWWYAEGEMFEGQSPKKGWGDAVREYLESQKITSDPLVPVKPQTFNHFAPLAVYFYSYTKTMSAERAQYNRLQSVAHPSSQVFFADCRGSYGSIQNAGKGGSIWNWGWSAPSTSMANWTHDKLTNYGGSGGQIDFKRGDGKAKVAFLDGHVEIVTPQTLTHRMVDPACGGF
jgi:prepilin-type N-terminal cleavage/methylation domain-containing protein/prepilin-type processing-associated H-X9-DG protein